MPKARLSALDPAALKGRTVLVRADLNVPLDGIQVTDDTRLRASVPTLRLLVEAGARVVLMSHLGRPKGAVDPQFSLAPVCAELHALLGDDDPAGRRERRHELTGITEPEDERAPLAGRPHVQRRVRLHCACRQL